MASAEAASTETASEKNKKSAERGAQRSWAQLESTKHLTQIQNLKLRPLHNAGTNWATAFLEN